MSAEQTTLGEYIKVQGGFAFKSNDFHESGRFPVLKIKNIRFGTVDYSDTSFINEKIANEAKDWCTQEGDILISMTGSGPNAPQSLVGRVARVWANEPKAWINQRVGRIILKDEKSIDKDFIYYLLTMPSSQEFLVSNSSGSANQANISGKTIESLPCPKINYIQSKSIATILRCIDQKIILNTQTNQTLESIAQAIFKSWFVDFEPVKAKMAVLADGGTREQAELAAMGAISSKSETELAQLQQQNPEHYQQLAETAALFPSAMVESELGEIPEGWEVKALDEVCFFQNGFAFSSKDLTTDKTKGTHKVFKMGNIKKGGGFDSTGSKDYFDLGSNPKVSRYLIQKGDLLMCMTDMKNNVALLGHTALMPIANQYLVNQRVGLIRKSESHYLNYPFFYYQSNEENFIQDVRSRANSGVQVNLSTQGIKETRLVVPSEQVHCVFDKVVKELLENIFSNDLQSETLAELRDSLLPKLLSGEIDLSDIQSEVA